MHQDPSSGTTICQLVETESALGEATEWMSWPEPGKEPAVNSVILDDKSTAKSAAQRWAREMEAKVVAGVWLWWTDWSRSDDG